MVPSRWFPYSTWAVNNKAFSDHHISVLTVVIPPTDQRKQLRWIIKNADWRKFAERVKQKLWKKQIQPECNVDKDNEALPKERRRKITPWLCKDAADAVRRRTKAWKDRYKDKTSDNAERLLKTRRETSKIIERLNQECWKNLVPGL